MHNQGADILLLGAISVAPPTDTEPEALGHIVEQIDQEVTTIVNHIVACGKTPIGIGGGHNNAYGHLKGSALGVQQPVNALNIDAHTDLRSMDYRHSGNGFSYAMQGDTSGTYLDKYVIFGLHYNYTPQYIYDAIHAQPDRISVFEWETMPRLSQQLDNMEKALDFISESYFGLELDCDAIAHFPSSAQSPAGFDLSTTRQLIIAAAQRRPVYFHLCEAAPLTDSRIR